MNVEQLQLMLREFKRRKRMKPNSIQADLTVLEAIKSGPTEVTDFLSENNIYYEPVPGLMLPRLEHNVTFKLIEVTVDRLFDKASQEETPEFTSSVAPGVTVEELKEIYEETVKDSNVSDSDNKRPTRRNKKVQE